jgi:hypothetical protein
MRQHGNAVPGKMHIRLDGMRAHLNGTFEGAHCVFGPRRLVSPVRNGLWYESRAITLGCQGGCPRRWSPVSRPHGKFERRHRQDLFSPSFVSQDMMALGDLSALATTISWPVSSLNGRRRLARVRRRSLDAGMAWKLRRGDHGVEVRICRDQVRAARLLMTGVFM